MTTRFEAGRSSRVPILAGRPGETVEGILLSTFNL